MGDYVPLYRRRRSGATDYRARKKAIMYKGTLLAVRVSGKNVAAQFLKPTVTGDLVLSSAHSHALRKVGWKGSLKSLPACYLLGLWAGKKAKQQGIEEAILYNGPAPFVKGSRISAFVKGVIDSGVKVPFSAEAFPSEERLKGENISKYAAGLASEDKALYDKRFSALIRLGFKPEDYAQNYNHTKDAIMGASN
ncbi:MAG: 50S ribosomal protein L18 [Thaumarchaeota archaeon]|nr:50S ribosomal protein L18 [Nitrososphaerota archaeon]